MWRCVKASIFHFKYLRQTKASQKILLILTKTFQELFYKHHIISKSNTICNLYFMLSYLPLLKNTPFAILKIYLILNYYKVLFIVQFITKDPVNTDYGFVIKDDIVIMSAKSNTICFFPVQVQLSPFVRKYSICNLKNLISFKLLHSLIV